MLRLDTRQYINLLLAQMRPGRPVSLAVWGSSMAPFLIHGRDAVLLAAPERPLKPGDVALFERPSGQYVLHRVCRTATEGLYFMGDGQQQAEGPVPPQAVRALAIKARRKGRWLSPGSFWWEFFARVWPHLGPLRGALSALYGAFKRKEGPP